MSAGLASRVDALEAQAAVRTLKAAYMQGLDDRRRGAVADLFWEDAVWEALPERVPDGVDEAPGAGERIVGREAIAASFVDAAARMSFTAHFLTNESITVSGDRAVGRWKLLQACTAGRDTAFWQAGVYVDDFERRDGEWRFAHLRLAMDFRTPYHEGWLATRMWELPTVGAGR
ncbi:nuclear transport factor 2 family protein [Pseudonocardia ailaonensis]|uniref:Nuclear transport factor 2 family protein n=1 Tax=Pseudonocardia ailaonensis TaxID=367279 RepID=A0ABN2N4N2_9PSEU